MYHDEPTVNEHWMPAPALTLAAAPVAFLDADDLDAERACALIHEEILARREVIQSWAW